MKIKEVPKFLWNNPKYLIPGYGTYKEFQKPKEERTKRNALGWGVYGLWWAVRLNWVGIGMIAGNWAPDNFTEYFKNDEEKVAKVQNNNENNLEKTINLQDWKIK